MGHEKGELMYSDNEERVVAAIYILVHFPMQRPVLPE